ncbi:histidinol-phosphatase [Acuticoccus sp.]|uniref:histidinol-phosphatase n=1 Tax=Acuticoccus sp. TaxID=1904378 RepID=UPI003B518631
MIADADLLHALADAAEAAVLPHFRQLAYVDNKASEGFDPVTVADREAEAAMRAILARERPDDAVVGEELAEARGTSGRTWILDPIDGTRAFIAGLPTWGVLIALAEDGSAVRGMMAQPFVGERFVGGPDGAYWSRGSQQHALAARRCATLGEAVLASTGPQHFDVSRRERFATLAAACRMVRYGTDCYGYAMVAAGHIDVVVEAGLKVVDIAPFVPMITAAGGTVTDWQGAPFGHRLLTDFRGDVVAVGDADLLPQVLAALAE